MSSQAFCRVAAAAPAAFPMFGAPPKPLSRPFVTVEEFPGVIHLQRAALKQVDAVEACDLCHGAVGTQRTVGTGEKRRRAAPP